MWRLLTAAGVTAGFVAGLSTTDGIAAETACGKRTDIVTGFAKTYKEEPSAVGVTDQGALIEVLVGPTGTWTMLLTMPGGPACIIGTGEGWRMRPAPGTDRLA